MDPDRSQKATLDEESVRSMLPQPEPRDELEGVRLGERYQLKRRIGEGGFGAVYEAVDERFDSPVAVKLLFAHKSTSQSTFRKEAKLIRRFKHPNVVEVYDYGVDDGVAYIVMDYLNGTPLNKVLLREDKQFSTEMLRQFVDQIGSALQNAHEKNLVHRDLKPHNVMLIEEGTAAERFVLLDLGMATKTDAGRDETIGNSMINSGLTPQYAAPEQFRREPVTHLADIYAFGTILYQFLTGRLPFVFTGSLGQLWHAVENNPPPPFNKAAPERTISVELQQLVYQCLAKQPHERPQAMREVRERCLAALGAPAVDRWVHADSHERTFTVITPGLDSARSPTERLGGDSADTDRTLGAAGAGTATSPASATAAPATDPTSISRLESLPVGAAQPVRKRAWGLPAAVVLLAVVAGGLFLFNRGGGEAQPPPLAIQSAGGPWTVAQGRPQPIVIRINPESRVEAPGSASSAGQVSSHPMLEIVGDVPAGMKVQAEGLPDGVQIELPDSLPAQGDVSCNVTANRSVAPRDIPFKIVADAAGRTSEHTATLRVVWMPEDSHFEPANGPDGVPDVIQDARTEKNYYARLDRDVDGVGRVPFVLVCDDSPRPPGAPAAPLAFYVLENKVWIGLFAAFANEQPDGISTSWNERLDEFERSLDDETFGLLPVVNVPAVDGLRFAKWLGGPRADLPSGDQWRTAAGLFEYDLQEGKFRDPRWNDWKDGPYTGSSVAVGKFAGHRLPVVRGDPAVADGAVDDVSPRFFVRGMAGNVNEWTSDLSPAGRLSLDGKGDAVMVGRHYTGLGPLKYEELWESLQNLQAENAREAFDDIGFRVVVNPE